jgi:titin
VIAGNGVGVAIRDSGTTGNNVMGNFLGTDISGAVGLNGGSVLVEAGAEGNTIGGTTPGSRNVMSGNGYPYFFGAVMLREGANGNIVSGNYIGTDAGGTQPIGNDQGVRIEDSNGNFVLHNVIADTYYAGVTLFSGSNNTFLGNYVGTDKTGSIALPNREGIHIGKGTGNVIGGTSVGDRNIIAGNNGPAIGIQGAQTRVLGNYIGITPSGDTGLGNEWGVLVEASGVTVGGTSAGARNVISGNANEGVGVRLGASGAVVQGNYIGTNAAGTVAIPNDTGVDVYRAAGSNTIGGTTSGAGNLIAGNNGSGIALRDANTTFNTVKGNRVGTNAAGTAALPNAIGVFIGSGASGNTIGGTSTAARNVISGNTIYGVLIAGDSTLENRVFRNRIGTNAAGTAGVPNGTGVLLAGGTIGNQIGGTTTGQTGSRNGNTIRFNNGAGVVVDATDGATQLNSIMGNSIDDNDGLGISLVAGANDEQPAPEITSVDTFIDTTIEGTLDTLASSTGYTIELFSSPDCDPSGFGEGRTFVGSVDVSTDGSGHASFSKAVPQLTHGLSVTATATRDNGETSEFSACVLSPK